MCKNPNSLVCLVSYFINPSVNHKKPYTYFRSIWYHKIRTPLAKQVTDSTWIRSQMPKNLLRNICFKNEILVLTFSWRLSVYDLHVHHQDKKEIKRKSLEIVRKNRRNVIAYHYRCARTQGPLLTGCRGNR